MYRPMPNDRQGSGGISTLCYRCTGLPEDLKTHLEGSRTGKRRDMVVFLKHHNLFVCLLVCLEAGSHCVVVTGFKLSL